MEELSIQYFRDLLDKHIEELKNFCNAWKTYLTDKTIPEEVVDEVRTTVGLTNLLLAQKLKQFGELIDDSELKRGEKEITCVDLQGFWDMVFHEVQKICKGFKKLELCQSNNWVFVEEEVATKVEVKKKPALAATAKVAVASKAHAAAAKQRLAEAKQRMMEAKKKMMQAQKGAKEEIVIMAANPKVTVTTEMAEEDKVELKQVSETVKEEDSKKGAKKSGGSRSNKKVLSSQEGVGQQKKQKSERTPKGKENVVEDSKKSQLSAAPPTKARRSKSPKVFPPLQCVTRSAMRALLAQKVE